MSFNIAAVHTAMRSTSILSSACMYLVIQSRPRAWTAALSSERCKEYCNTATTPVHGHDSDAPLIDGSD